MNPQRRLDQPDDRRRSDRRRFIRDHHPDRGGDQEAFIDGLKALSPDVADRVRPAVTFYRRPRGLRRVALVTKKLFHRHIRPSTSTRVR